MSHADAYSLIAYGNMVEDVTRFAPWHEALRRHVHAGSTVLDLGTGPGIMAFLACQLGARRVYAIEPDSSIEVAKLCAAGIPGAERIEWIRSLSTEVELPEPVDLVVGDLHGNLPFYTGNIAAMADARRRLLRPGGIMLPSRDTLYAVPASAPWEVASIDAPWRSNALQLDLTPALPWLLNGFWRARGEPTDAEHLLADVQRWGCVDYRAEVENRGLDATLDWTFARTGQVDGLYVWFDGEVDAGLGFSNSPLLPELVYGRTFFPLEHPVAIQIGDTMRTRLGVHRLHDNWVFRWDTRISSADGQALAAFRQSTVRLLPGGVDALRKSEASHMPTLDEAGQIQLEILRHMDGSKALTEIARIVLDRFPNKFRNNFDRALADVASCARQFS